MLPARALVAGLPAPPDASTPAVGRRSIASRRRRLCPWAVRIVTAGCLRGRPPRGGVDPIILLARNPSFDAGAYCRGSRRLDWFRPPALSEARTNNVSV